MLSLATIEQYQGYAATSQFLACEEINRSKALDGGTYESDRDIPILLYALNENIEWAKRYFLGKPELDNIVNFMYALCSRYLQRAIAANANSSNPIVPSVPPPVIPPVDVSGLSFPHVQFIIGIPNAFMEELGTEVSITDDHIVDGSVRVTVDGVRLPYGVSSVLSYTASYGVIGVTVTFNSEAQLGQVYQIDYEKIA